jgi:hypothetical protein
VDLPEWLGDWLSYRPSDFLMFAPRTYWRLFELHNAAWWPWQWPMLALGAAGVWGVAGRARQASSGKSMGNPQPAWGLRAVCGGLALAWAWVAATFLHERYAPINWAADALTVLFAAQALVLAALALCVRPNHALGPVRRSTALALGVVALAGYPLLAALPGRSWAQAEFFGFAPDPTVLATWAVLMALPQAGCGATRGATPGAHRLRRLAQGIALACMIFSAATLITMKEWQGGILCVAMLLAALARGLERRAGSAATGGAERGGR